MKGQVLVLSGLLACASAASLANSEFDEWLAAQKTEYQNYRNQLDQEFADWLSREWQVVPSFKAAPADQQPKLPEQPVAEPVEAAPVTVPEVKPKTLSKSEKVLPKVEQPKTSQQGHFFGFLDQNIRVADLKWPELNTVFKDSASIADAWAVVAQVDAQAVISDINKYLAEYQLSGWDRLQIFGAYARSIYEQKDQQTLATWYLLIQSGYASRIAFTEASNLVLLVATRNALFDVPYLQMDGQKFYVLDIHGQKVRGNLVTYQGQHGKASAFSSVFVSPQLPINRDWSWKTYSFKYANQSYQVEVPVNDIARQYLSVLPQVSLQSYFANPLDQRVEAALKRQFAPVLASMSPREKAAFLLAFVQTAFEYQTDQQQFGREEYLWPLESLSYGIIDCEDRSHLYAKLVRSLAGLEVVALDYPGHVSVAIALDVQPGDAILKVAGRDFVIADPTYINAAVGQAMPAYKDVAARVIAVP